MMMMMMILMMIMMKNTTHSRYFGALRPLGQCKKFRLKAVFNLLGYGGTYEDTDLIGNQFKHRIHLRLWSFYSIYKDTDTVQPTRSQLSGWCVSERVLITFNYEDTVQLLRIQFLSRYN